MTPAEALLEKTIHLQSRCDALEAALFALALHSGLDPQTLLEILEKTQNQTYSERLLELSKTDQACAARIDRRPEHGEDLAPHRKLVKFPPPQAPPQDS